MVTAQEAQLIVSGASVVFAGALVVVTFLYYIETKDQTEEMQATRKANVKPFLKVSFDAMGGGYFLLSIKNTGRGAAHHVKADWGVEDIEDAHHTLKTPMIDSGEGLQFEIIPTDGRMRLFFKENIEDKIQDSGSAGVLTFNACCRDTLENKHEFEEEIDIMESLNTREDGSIRGNEAKISSAVEGIESSLEDIKNKL